MALTQVFTAGSRPSATKLNESSIPVVSSTSDISAPYTGQIVFSTTDTRLWRFTGSVWITFSGGPVWAFARTTAQSIANGTWTTVTWPTENIDTGNMHSTVSNTDAVTINQAGVYSVSVKGGFAANSTGVRGARLLLNGTLDANAVQGATVLSLPNNIGPAATPLPTVYLQLAVNDVLRVQVYQNSGGALNTAAIDPGDYPLFNGTWLRD